MLKNEEKPHWTSRLILLSFSHWQFPLLKENKIFHKILIFSRKVWMEMNQWEQQCCAVFVHMLQEADRVTWSWGVLKAEVTGNRTFRALQPLLTTFGGSSRVYNSLCFGKQLLSVLLRHGLKQFAQLKSGITQDCIREILIHIIYLSCIRPGDVYWCPFLGFTCLWRMFP